MSTAISIKHRILATVSVNKNINSDSLYAFNRISSIEKPKTKHEYLWNYVFIY